MKCGTTKLEKATGFLQPVAFAFTVIINALDTESVFFLKEPLIWEKEQGCHILISSRVLSFLDGLVTQSVF